MNIQTRTGIFILVVCLMFSVLLPSALCQNSSNGNWWWSFAPDYSAYSSGGLIENLSLGNSSQWVYSTPTINSDGVFIQSGERVYAFDHNGNELWNITQGGGGTDTSSPTIYNNTLIHVDSNAVYARNLTDGTQIWQFNSTCDNFNSIDASPIALNGRVWVASKLCAYTLNADTGALISTFQPPNITDYTAHRLGPATISEGVVHWNVVYGSDNIGAIIAVNESNGSQILWNYTLESLEIPSGISWENNGISIHGDRLFTAIHDQNTSETSFVLSLNKTNGTFLWQYNLTEEDQMFTRSFPVVYGGKVIVASTEDSYAGPSIVYAFNETDGTLVWQYNITGEYIYSSPAVADSKAIIGTGNSTIYAISTLNGSHIWNYTFPYSLEATPSIVNNTVYIGDMNGTVHKLKSNITYSNASVNITAGSATFINARNRTDTTLNITASSNGTGQINITKYFDAPSQITVNISGVTAVRYIEVNSTGINDNMSWAMVKLYYSEDDLISLDLNESSMELYSWTGSGWECGQCGVDIDENYVYINVTEFSVFEAGGRKVNDFDLDGILDLYDNCPTVYNPTQLDSDGDGRGNACDYDRPEDIVEDEDEQVSGGGGASGGSEKVKEKEKPLKDEKVPKEVEQALTGPLFDIELTIPEDYLEVQVGKKLLFSVKLTNLGLPGRADVTLEYWVKDSQDNTVYQSSETVAVETSASFTHEIDLPSGMALGDYIFYAEVLYGENQTAIASTPFKIAEKKPIPKWVWYFGLFILLILIIAGILVLYRKKIKEKMDERSVKRKVRDVIKKKM